MHWLCWAMPVAAYSSFQRSSPQYFSCFPGPSAGRQEPVRHASSSGYEWCRDMFFQGCSCGAWCYVVGEQEMAQLLRGRSTSSAQPWDRDWLQHLFLLQCAAAAAALVKERKCHLPLSPPAAVRQPCAAAVEWWAHAWAAQQGTATAITQGRGRLQDRLDMPD